MDRELARATVVVQPKIEMRTGQIRIQRTFLSQKPPFAKLYSFFRHFGQNRATFPRLQGHI